MEVLPLVVSPTATHHLYIKRHQANADSIIPGDRTLFVSNLPVDCTERLLGWFFKAHGCGSVEKVSFAGLEDFDRRSGEDGTMQLDEEGHEGDIQPTASTSKVVPLPSYPPSLRTSGQAAHVVFLDQSSLSVALELPKNRSKKYKWPPSSSDGDAPTGLARFTAMYDARRPPLSVARGHADSYMEDYTRKAEAAKLTAKYKKGEAVVDEDGFTLVTRGGTYGTTLGGGASVANRKFQLAANSGAVHDAEKQKRKKKEKPDFYTFQIRDKKRNQFMDLRRKFEEDKAKLQKLKEARRFKPY